MTAFEEDISAYEVISILGECFQGRASVNLAKHRKTGQMLAMKCFHLDNIFDNFDLIEKEISLTKQLQHPNILPYYTSFVNESKVFVVSPLQAFGSCKSLLNSHFNEGLPELAVISILKDVLEAVNYLHKKGFIHRAVRASHILVSASGKACLCGLRYAYSVLKDGRWQKTIHSFPLTTQPNLNWLSPELLEQNLRGYNEKSDIYSIGMVCCELGNGREPFADVDSTLMLLEKVRGCSPGLLDCTTMPPSSVQDDEGVYGVDSNFEQRRFSQYLHDFCYVCLEKEPQNRPTASELLTHPVFKLLRRNVYLPDLLKPALPLSDKVAFNEEEMADVNLLRPYQLDSNNYDWDFTD